MAEDSGNKGFSGLSLLAFGIEKGVQRKQRPHDEGEPSGASTEARETSDTRPVPPSSTRPAPLPQFRSELAASGPSPGAGKGSSGAKWVWGLVGVGVAVGVFIWLFSAAQEDAGRSDAPSIPSPSDAQSSLAPIKQPALAARSGEREQRVEAEQAALEAKVSEILERIREDKWGAARTMLDGLGEGDLTAAHGEIEAAAVSVVEARPAGDLEGRKAGYEFLVQLRPGNPAYREKVEQAALGLKVADLLNSIGEGRWDVAAIALDGLGAGDLTAAHAEIEAVAVSVVEASPAGDPSGNQEGYAFLSRLRPDNAVYRERAEEHQGLESGMLQPSLSATPETEQPGTDQAWQLTFDIQTVLTNLGYNPGTADGIYGPNTKAAIEAFQRSSGIPADGQVSQGLLGQLMKVTQGRAEIEPASP